MKIQWHCIRFAVPDPQQFVGTPFQFVYSYPSKIHWWYHQWQCYQFWVITHTHWFPMTNSKCLSMKIQMEKEITPSMTSLIRPILKGLQQLSPMPCQMTTGTGGSWALQKATKIRTSAPTLILYANDKKIKKTNCCFIVSKQTAMIRDFFYGQSKTSSTLSSGMGMAANWALPLFNVKLGTDQLHCPSLSHFNS